MEEQQRFGAPQNDVVDDRSFWDRIWYNEDGDVVIWQWPNVWLIGWAAVNFVSIIAPSRGISSVTWWVGFALLTIWAVLEIVKGANYFRRFLGVAALLLNITLALHGGF